MPVSYIDVQRRGKTAECPALQCRNFAIDHDVHGRGCFEFDAAHCAGRSERMFDMRTVIKTRQCAEQAQPSDRAPADKFNQPVPRISLRRDEHRAARILAVVERQEKSAPLVPLLIVVATQGQGSPAQLHHAHEDAEQITEIAKRLEHAIGQSSDIGRKANAQKIEGINFAGGVRQAQKIDGASAAFEERLHRSCGSVLCKIAQEGIAGTQRQEPQRDALNGGAPRKNAVEDFVGGAITADGKKAPVPLPVGFAGKLHRMARTRRSNDLDLQPFLEQTRESGPSEFRGAAATGGGVDDGKESIHLDRERARSANSRSTQSFPNQLHKGRIAAALSSFARRSARILRLILREAVRGKSSSSRTTPWTRL